MAAYSGPCEVLIAGEYVSGTASLIQHDDGSWFGQVRCDRCDWFSAQLQATPVTIRMPSGRTGVVAVNHFTYFFPGQAHVTGTSASPL